MYSRFLFVELNKNLCFLPEPMVRIVYFYLFPCFLEYNSEFIPLKLKTPLNDTPKNKNKNFEISVIRLYLILYFRAQTFSTTKDKGVWENVTKKPNTIDLSNRWYKICYTWWKTFLVRSPQQFAVSQDCIYVCDSRSLHYTIRVYDHQGKYQTRWPVQGLKLKHVNDIEELGIHIYSKTCLDKENQVNSLEQKARQQQQQQYLYVYTQYSGNYGIYSCTGELKWCGSWRISSSYSRINWMSSFEDELFICEGGVMKIFVFDAQTQKLTRRLILNKFVSCPLGFFVFHNVFILTEKNVHIFDRKTGKEIQCFEYPQTAKFYDICFAENCLVGLSTSGVLKYFCGYSY